MATPWTARSDARCGQCQLTEFMRSQALSVLDSDELYGNRTRSPAEAAGTAAAASLRSFFKFRGELLNDCQSSRPVDLITARYVPASLTSSNLTRVDQRLQGLQTPQRGLTDRRDNRELNALAARSPITPPSSAPVGASAYSLSRCMPSLATSVARWCRIAAMG